MATIADFVRKHAIRRPNKTAYIYESGDVTWLQLEQRVEALATGLWAKGIRPGDAVAICVTDGPVQVEAFFALARLGAHRVGLNYRFSAGEIEQLCAHSEVKLILVADEFLPLVSGCAPEFGIVRAGDAQSSLEEYDSLLKSGASLPEIDVAPDDIVQICYTTGSTGSPKGAVWCHAAVSNAMAYTLLDIGFDENDVYLHCLPSAGVPSILMGWNVVIGFTTVVMPKFDPVKALAHIDNHQCTTALFIPTMLAALCETAGSGEFNLQSMRKVLYGSAPTPPALVERVTATFANSSLEQIYGSTEGCGGWYTKLSARDHKRAIEGNPDLLTSCGQPMIHCQVKTVGAAGERLSSGEIGEICVKGPFLMEGYFKAPELSSSTLQNGWLHTGDMGRLDEDGYLYLVDRKQFMIITGGYNVYPIEIENLIASHPMVLEVCVFGLPDPKWGEAIHAAVVPRNGKGLDERELVEWCRGKIAEFKVPKTIEIRDTLLRGATGKVLKRAERDRMLMQNQG